MLKIGCVYLLKNEGSYWYVHSKRKYRRVFYVIKRVKLNGTLGTSKEVPFKRGEWTKVDVDIKVEIRVGLSETLRDQMEYDGLVGETRKLIREFADKSKRKDSVNYHRVFAINAMASIGRFDSRRGVHIDFKVFAKDIGLKSPVKIYNWVAENYKRTCPPKKYTHVLKNASDATILGAYNQYRMTYKYLYGNSKKLNALVETDIKGYIDEMYNRDMGALVTGM